MKKVALVTGASAGMGKATARQLLADGYVVYGAARRLEQMRDIEKEGVIPLRMDLTNDGEITAAVERISAERGGVDILVNNAGYNSAGPVEHVSIDEARRQFDVNLFGLARLTQLIIPPMRKRGAGTIVNVTSVGGKAHTPLGAWYHATKFALEGWSDCLRLELKAFGIDVIIIEPGGVKSEFGGIMDERIRETTKGTGYEQLAQGVLGMTAKSADNQSPPEVVARTISKAVRAKRPRTRYATGYGARPLLLTRSLLSDRLYDGLILSMYK